MGKRKKSMKDFKKRAFWRSEGSLKRSFFKSDEIVDIAGVTNG